MVFSGFAKSSFAKGRFSKSFFLIAEPRLFAKRLFAKLLFAKRVVKACKTRKNQPLSPKQKVQGACVLPGLHAQCTSPLVAILTLVALALSIGWGDTSD